MLDQTDIETSANVAVDDILHRIPGFSLFRRSSSMFTSPNIDPEAQGVTLRGIGPSGASRALVMVDGIPVIDPVLGQVFWSKLSRDNIDRIEVVRGAGASLWGNYAMAGVINIITRKPTENGVATKASYGTHGLTDDNLSVTGKLDRFTIGLDGHFFDTDGYPVVAGSQRGRVDGDSSSRHEIFNGRIGYQLSDSASISLHGQYFDETRNDGTALRDSGTSSGLIDLNGQLRTVGGSEWQLTLFSNQQSFHIQFSEASEDRTSEHRTQRQQIPFTDVGASLVWSKHLLDSLLLTAGTDQHWIDGRTKDDFFDEAGQDIELKQRSDGKQFFNGFFLQGIYTPAPKWQIALGGRVDVWTNYDGTQSLAPDVGGATQNSFGGRTDTAFSPRLSVLYSATDWLQVRGAAYQGFRAPTLGELYRRSSVESLILVPNPDLKAEHLDGAELGFDLPILASFDFRATGFWSQINDAIADIDVDDALCGRTEEGAAAGSIHPQAEAEPSGCRQRQNLGLARTVGAEVDALYEVVPHLTVYGSYLFADASVVRAPTERDLQGKQLAQIPPHSFTLGARFDNRDLFTLNLEGRFIDDQFEDAANTQPLRSYFILNGMISRRLPVVDGEVFLAAENLFDREYAVDRGGGILKVGTPLLGHGGIRVRF